MSAFPFAIRGFVHGGNFLPQRRRVRRERLLQICLRATIVVRNFLALRTGASRRGVVLIVAPDGSSWGPKSLPGSLQSARSSETIAIPTLAEKNTLARRSGKGGVTDLYPGRQGPSVCPRKHFRRGKYFFACCFFRKSSIPIETRGRTNRSLSECTAAIFGFLSDLSTKPNSDERMLLRPRAKSWLTLPAQPGVSPALTIGRDLRGENSLWRIVERSQLDHLLRRRSFQGSPSA